MPIGDSIMPLDEWVDLRGTLDAAQQYRDDIAAFDSMLEILDKNEYLDAVTLFEIEEGTVEHSFWIRRFTDFKVGARTYRDATYLYGMTREHLLHNRGVALKKLAECEALLAMGGVGVAGCGDMR